MKCCNTYLEKSINRKIIQPLKHFFLIGMNLIDEKSNQGIYLEKRTFYPMLLVMSFYIYPSSGVHIAKYFIDSI